jgi:hypothetical protein
MTTSSDKEPIQLYSEKPDGWTIVEELPTSLSLGDPTLHEVLQWHISLCGWCANGSLLKPPPFGERDNRKCPEYYEIVAEYSEYEATYIRWGKP